jgi:predicted nucleic acid-binding protein
LKRILVDVNVLLDAVLERTPHAEAAAKIWAAVETRSVTGLVPGHGVTTLFYLFSRARGAHSARRAVAHLLTVFGVAVVNQATLQRALTLGWTDYEDAVCAAAAEATGCDLIVTRDPTGFPVSPVQTVDPATALALLEREDGTSRLSEPRRAPYAAGRRTARERPRRRPVISRRSIAPPD